MFSSFDRDDSYFVSPSQISKDRQVAKGPGVHSSMHNLNNENLPDLI